MKTIFRFLVLGILATAFSAAAVTSSFAQDECANVEANQALYKKYTDNYAGKLDQVKVAITAAEEYVGKYEACVDAKTNAPMYADQVNYLKGALPERKEWVQKQQGIIDAKARIDRFNAAAKAKNVPEVFTSGKDILAHEPDFLDVIITMAVAGYTQTTATPPVATYNDDVINYSKMAIEKIEAGKPSTKYGAFTYGLVDKDNALGVLNYNIAYTMYFRQDKKKEALPYFYKSIKYNSYPKNFPFLYQTLGANYLDEFLKIDTDRKAKIKAAGDKDTPETLELLAMQKGYADRAIDAYARAYKLAKDDKTQKPESVANLNTRFKELYAFRYDEKIDGIDAYLATVMNKSLPDPTTPITPVKEDPPVAPTTPTTPATNTTKPPTTPATTKPATKPPTTKPVGSTTSDASTDAAATTTPTTAAKTKAKKPAPKKKGTR